MDQKELFSKRTFALFMFIGIALNATCFFSDILEPDGALYATIAKHIVLHNDWLNLFSNGADWLDKPHLPFWLTAISFKLFGISSFTYKLPSFICWLAGVWYCYKLSAKIYSVKVAQLSTIIYITALHVILSNADVRAEGYLTTFILAATYYIYNAYINNKLTDIILAALFSAFAIMTKGIFTIVTIASGFIIYWIWNKEWKEFAKPKWYLLVVLILIFILPELYALYMQFDLHPEKIVFGKTNVSGIHFFFWDSQFGRFMNNGPIKGAGDPFFFFHTTLWAFLPWSFIFLIVLFNSFKKTSGAIVNKHAWIIGSSALVTFLMFSLSKFQLPHYIVIVFPHFAMIIAYWMLEKSSDSILKKISIIQIVLFVILSTLVILLVYYTGFSPLWLAIIAIIISSVFIFSKTSSYQLSIIKINMGFALLLALFLNTMFYPGLLPYQAGMTAAKWMNENHPGKTVFMYKCRQFTFQFYCKGEVGFKDTATEQMPDSILLFTPMSRINELKKNVGTEKLIVLNSFSNFHVTQVTLPFLDKRTRSNELDTFVIAMITKQ
jgi:4-amino-4-deoxy-L-arabinose transferase-like glycosyltransferase